MDINNYSYTPYMLVSDAVTYAEYQDIDMDVKITLEQWGSDLDMRHFVVADFLGDFCEDFITDCSRGWGSMRQAYEKAARTFNDLVPIEAAIPLF